MEVLLNKELENFVNSKVQSGDYNNTNEVMEKALLLLLEQEHKKERLKEALQAGYDDYKNGRTVKKTAHEILQEVIETREKI